MVTTNFDSARDLVEKMLKGDTHINGEWFEENCQEAYLDWTDDDGYKNITSKAIADSVGRYYQEQGYNVYYQCYGYHPNHYYGEPACLRINKKERRYGSLTKDFC